VPDEAVARGVLHEALRRNAPVVRFEIDYPSLNDVFLAGVRGLPEPDTGRDGTAASAAEVEARAPVAV
jgi:hypothetical protein